jgi:YbgC/YbaW family acyl-CoA thioester hydrolase
VRSYELDSFGHANHAVVLNWFEEARWEALREGGLPAAEIRARGWGVYVVRIEVDYRKEARLGDELRIETRVEGYGRSTMTIRQRAVREEDAEVVVAEATVLAVWIGPDGRPFRVPAEVRAALGGP